MTDLPEIAWTVAHGESIDRTESVPLGAAPAVDAVFSLALVSARGDEAAALRFDEPDTLIPGDWATGALPIVFHAPAARLHQIAAGNYIGDLIMETPREGALGPERLRVALVSLEIEGGTGS